MNNRVSGTPVSSYFRKTPTERFPHNDDGSKISGMELNQCVHSNHEKKGIQDRYEIQEKNIHVI